MDNRLKEFYKKYPGIFIENNLNLKLSLWQKILLRLII
jgi:hypothetical protein